MIRKCRKAIALLLVMFLLAAVSPVEAKAAASSLTFNDEYGTWVYDTASQLLTSYRGNAAYVTIPSSFTLNGTRYQIRGVGDNCFYGNSTMTDVTVTSSTPTVMGAFQNCTALTSAHLGNNISLNRYAFNNCSRLTAIYAYDNVGAGYECIMNCPNLRVYCNNSPSLISYCKSKNIPVN